MIKMSRCDWFQRGVQFVFFIAIWFILIIGCQRQTSGFQQTPPAFTKTVTDVATGTDMQTSVPFVHGTPTEYSIPSGLKDDLPSYTKWLFTINESPTCDLPCWWGLEPLKTNIDRVLQLLNPFEIEVIPMPFVATSGWYGFYIDDSYVGAIDFNAFFMDDIYYGSYVGFPMRRKTIAGEQILMNQYSLQAILQRFGQPNEVFLGLPLNMADPGAGQSEYEIWLLYEDRGLLVGYLGPFQLPKPEETEILVCPNFDDLTYVRLYLQGPSLEQGTLSMDEWYSGQEVSINARMNDGEILTWENATGSSISIFYETFRLPTNDVCFSTPVGFWG